MVSVSHAYLRVAFFFIVTIVTVFLAITDPVQGYAAVITAFIIVDSTFFLEMILNNERRQT